MVVEELVTSIGVFFMRDLILICPEASAVAGQTVSHFYKFENHESECRCVFCGRKESETIHGWLENSPFPFEVSDRIVRG